MPVLGSGGRVLFKRPTPSACTLQPEDYKPGCNAFTVNCPGWWSGDRVCVEGLPILDGGLPVNVDGYASYQGSRWYLGPNRTQISSNADQFYKNDTEDYPTGAFGDDANFYAKNGVGDVPDAPPQDCYWVHIDQFGRIRFYDNRCKAVAGCANNAIELADYLIGEPITLYPPGEQEYQNARWDCLYDECLYLDGEYWFSDVQDEVTDVSICASAPEFDFPVAANDEYGNADVQPRPNYAWPTAQALCNIREYTLNLDAPAIDTTLVGEKFGENVKSLVNGGGSFEFFIDRACFGEEQEEASWMLMNLLMLTEGGCSGNPVETEAWFYLYENGGCNDNSCFPPVGGSLYYKANILITQTAINVRPDQMIAGTAEFVTTGEIQMLQGA